MKEFECNCPKCNETLKINDANENEIIQCPKCNSTFVVGSGNDDLIESLKFIKKAIPTTIISTIILATFIPFSHTINSILFLACISLCGISVMLFIGSLIMLFMYIIDAVCKHIEIMDNIQNLISRK